MANVIKTLFTNSAKTDALYPRTRTKAVFNDDGVDLDTLLENAGGGIDFDQIYPVGAIYMSTVNTSPATLFGVGTWEQIQDRFLLGAGSTYSAGSTGGSATVTLTTNEIPSHNHWIPRIIGDSGRQSSGWSDAYVDGGSTTGNTGGGQAHDNMPPYLVVYMWKRTA